jgi:hypothetical protein
MKKLYEFTLKEKVTNKVEEKSTDKDGNEVTITKDKTEEVDRVFFLKSQADQCLMRPSFTTEFNFQKASKLAY